MTQKAISLAPGNYPNLVETDRSLVDELAGRVAGVIFTSGTTMATVPDLRVTPAAAGHGFDVASGKAVLREKTNPRVRGGYFYDNDAVYSDTLPAPQANPFIATVVLRVTDPQYGTVTGTVGPRIDVISGTPASSPVAVSDAFIDGVTGTPGGWLRLADIRINTADTGVVPSGQFTDTRKPGGFGVINCLSTNLPTLTKAGIQVFVMDGNYPMMWNGSAWRGILPEQHNIDGGFPVAGSTTSEQAISRSTIAARPYDRRISAVGTSILVYTQAADSDLLIYIGASVAARSRVRFDGVNGHSMTCNTNANTVLANATAVVELRIGRTAGTGTLTSSVSSLFTTLIVTSVPAP